MKTMKGSYAQRAAEDGIFFFLLALDFGAAVAADLTVN